MLTVTILGSVIFTVLILFLVAILALVDKYIIASGNCKIVVNGNEDEALDVSSGSTLLSALATEKVFLPSACGGGGTCAMCKCVVVSGGGDVLPTEKGHLSRKEQKENVRLSCQVKIKNDMVVEIPDEIYKIRKFNATVRSNDNVATFIKELILDIDDGQILEFEAGGYCQIDIPPYEIGFDEFEIEKEYHPDWDNFKLWNLKAKNGETCFRAYSMANHPAEGNRIMLNVRIATPPPQTEGILPGIASSYIFNLKPGDKVQVSGPYGEFFIQETAREMVYIGGGAGMAPLRSHIFHLFHTEKTQRKVSYWYGARSLRETFYQEHFEDIQSKNENFSFHLALSSPLPEDNWKGSQGFIHQVVYDEYLKNHEAPEDIEYYLCGPPMMLSAVKEMLYSLGVEDKMIYFDDFG